MEELTGPLEEVFRDLKAKWRDFQDEPPFSEMFMGFIHAIDWTERWIQAIVACQVVMFAVAVLSRSNAVVQGVIFMLAAATIYMAEQLNALGAQHWEAFSKQDYFDKRGVFFSAVISGPLIIIMFVVLINYLVSCSVLLVKAKRQELRFKAKQRAQEHDKKD